MKILYHHRLGSKDGQMVHVEEIVRAFTDLGHQVVIVGPPATERANFGEDVGFIATLKKIVPARLYEWLELAYGFVAFWRLWWVYRWERPDVLYERYNLFLLAGVWLRRLTGMPMLLEINGPLAYERSRFGGLVNQRLANWIEGVTWRSADTVLPVTNVLADFVRRAGVDPKRIVVIQNGVSPELLAGPADKSSIRWRFGIEDRLVLGFTGFMRDWHGLDSVIDLVAESDPSRKLHLLLVGDGPALPELRRQATARNVSDRVTFAGLVARDEIADYVAAFDIAMQPQVVAYASPLKLFEYMALGRAIVAPSMPNICEVLTNGEDALLFDPADGSAFRAAVERLCADPALRERLGCAARAAIDRQGLTWANNARRIVALFESLRSGRSTAGR